MKISTVYLLLKYYTLVLLLYAIWFLDIENKNFLLTILTLTILIFQQCETEFKKDDFKINKIYEN